MADPTLVNGQITDEVQENSTTVNPQITDEALSDDFVDKSGDKASDGARSDL